MDDYMKDYDAEAAADDLIRWIRAFFKGSGGKTAVIGMSGGKDSTIVAALCAEALGKENVVGVIMPNRRMKDEKTAVNAAMKYCGKWMYRSIGPAYLHFAIGAGYNECTPKMDRDIYWEDGRHWLELRGLDGYDPHLTVTDTAVINLPARLRMCALYFVAQCVEHGRVANTCNLSEDWVGYATRYGDGAGDFAPLHDYTVQEVKAIGHYLGVPKELVEKVPDDGLCGKTDEDNLGFTYEVLDRYIRTGECEDQAVKEKIDQMHVRNLFKLEPIPYCYNGWWKNKE